MRVANANKFLRINVGQTRSLLSIGPLEGPRRVWACARHVYEGLDTCGAHAGTAVRGMRRVSYDCRVTVFLIGDICLGTGVAGEKRPEVLKPLQAIFFRTIIHCEQGVQALVL